MPKELKKVNPKPEVKKEKFVPEVIDKGVTRDEKKETPMDLVKQADENKQRFAGKWIKATDEEVAKYQSQGILVGYDREAGEVLLKETK